MIKFEFIPESKYAYKLWSMRFIAMAVFLFGLNETVTELLDILYSFSGVGIKLPETIFLRLGQVSVVLAGFSRLVQQKSVQLLITKLMESEEPSETVEEKEVKTD